MAGSASRHQEFTIADYVRLERFSNSKHEFVDGQIYAMGGGSREHATYAANVIVSLGNQLRDKPCGVQTSDARIRVSATGLDTYPDVSVVCGQPEHDTEDPLAITNPIVLVEVLSPSTEAYDRGEKLENYMKIDALREVLLVSHEAQAVDLVRRESDGSWSRHRAGAGERVSLRSIGCELAVDEIYRDPLAS